MSEPNDGDSAVKETSEVELRTVPNVREHASAAEFVKDYLAFVDDADEDVPQELIERQYTDIRQTAMQRGMRPTGDPSLVEQVKVDKRNVRLVYSLPVVVATPRPEQPETVEKAAVAGEQSATGEPVKKTGDAARTADGKDVDTSAPKTPATGSPMPKNAKKGDV